MDNFKNYNNLYDLVQKTAEAELLLSDISATPEAIVIHPVKCPAVGRKEDSLKDSEGNPACRFGTKVCKYFVSASFNLDGYDKNIVCSVM